MKILHTADWHLGKKLDYFARHDEQVEVLEEIEQIANEQQVDLVLVAGDLFDTFNPPVESMDLAYRTLKRLAKNGERPVVVIAGNHDSPDRIELPDAFARECGILFFGYPQSEIRKGKVGDGFEITQSAAGFIELKSSHFPHPVRIITTAYANEYRMNAWLGHDDKEQALRDLLQKHWADLANEFCDEQGVNLLCAHLFMIKEGEKPESEPEGEKPILDVGGAQVIFSHCIPPTIQYTALGHLHRLHQVNGAKGLVAYSGSPLAYSFSEAGQAKYLAIVEIEPAKSAEIHQIKLKKGKQLLRAKAQNTAEAQTILLQNPDSLIELTLQTSDFINQQEVKDLNNMHSGIIRIVPELINQKEEENKTVINPLADMETLFIQYFESKKGAKPNDEILQLFKEIQQAE